MFSTIEVSNFETSIFFNFSILANIYFISLTFDVLKFVTSKFDIFEQP